MNVLLGTIMEARGLNLAAKSFYEKALVENESDLVSGAACWRGVVPWGD